VVVFGSATIHGNAKDVVVVFGNVTVDGVIEGDTVAVMGEIKVEPTGHICGDAVAIGDGVHVAKGGRIDGHIQDINIGAFGIHVGWLRAWLVQCAFKFRPLAPQVGWVWAVAGVFFLLYVFTAAVFPNPVRVCVQELTERPTTTFLVGLLSKILIPLALFLLLATGIGVFVIPFVIAALVLGLIVGKAALLETLGLRIGQQFGLQALQKPLAALLLGAIIIALFYMVPVLGLLTFGVVSILGLGAVVRATFAGMRRESPPKPPKPAMAVPQPAMAMAGGSEFSSSPVITGEPADPLASEPATPRSEPFTPPSASFAAPHVMPEVIAFPRAGLWPRVAAGFLDGLLVMIVALFLGNLVSAHDKGPSLFFLMMLAYYSAMWTWKGTTVGGVVLGLKVAREDGQPLSFLVALVRSLAAAFSMVVAFLGFIWIAWDPEKQGWHDKIAGTVVLKVPRGRPLV